MTIEKLTTPVGRIVWGNPAKSQVKKDQETKQPVLKDGQTIEQWAFGVAFPKAEFEQKVYPYMAQEAATGYPQGIPPNFSWKFKDGDGVDAQGKPYNTREGYAGCYVLTISTEAFAPPIYKFENGAYRQITAEEIKCGDYVALNLNMKVNVPTSRTHTPGLFINPNGIELVGYGQAIMNSANPDELFGRQQHALPAGASATPIATNHGVAMPMAAAPAYAPAPMGMQPAPMPMAAAPAYAPAPMAAAPVYAPVAPAAPLPAPQHDFAQNAGMQPAAYAPAPMGMQPAPMQPGMQMPGLPIQR